MGDSNGRTVKGGTFTFHEKWKEVLLLLTFTFYGLGQWHKSERRYFHCSWKVEGGTFTFLFYFSWMIIVAEKWKDVLSPYAWKSLEFPSVRRSLPSEGHRSPWPAGERENIMQSWKHEHYLSNKSWMMWGREGIHLVTIIYKHWRFLSNFKRYCKYFFSLDPFSSLFLPPKKVLCFVKRKCK